MFIIALLVIGGLGTAQAYTGIIWTQETNKADFSGRIDHTSVAFDNKMWVIGGVNEDGVYYNDVLFSTNGVAWTPAIENAEFLPRSFHSSVVFDNKMWVIGGDSGLAYYFNDVWSSSDGITWTRATENAEFTPRTYHTSVVFDNKMWVIGGDDGTGTYLHEVWSSSDGESWTQVSVTTPFTARSYHTSEIFDNKMWVIGGSKNEDEYYNDAWYSTDGIKWTEATASASQGQQILDARSYHSSVVFNNKMWVIGGDDRSGSKYLNDVWSCEIRPNKKPTLDNPGPKQVAEGKSLTFDLTAVDDDDQLTYTFTSVPSLDGATISGNTFTWTPAAGTAGTYSVTFRVTDPDGESDEETIIITVTKSTVKIPVKIKIVPETLNLGCHGGVFVAFVQLPKEYTANEVIKNSITCGGAPAERIIKCKWFPHSFGVIFNRNKLKDVPMGDKVTLTLSGQLRHTGQVLDFEGSDTVRIINKYSKNKEEIDNVQTLSDDKIFERHFRPSQYFNNRK